MGIDIGAMIAVALAIQPASGTLSTPLKPSGPWIVDYASSMCVLQRQFGSGDAAVYLGFRPGLFSEHMRVVLMRKSRDRDTRFGIAELSFDGAPPLKAPYREGWIEKQNSRVTFIDLKVPDLEPLNHAKQFRIKAGKADIVLEPSRIEAALKALDPCQKDLMISWGMTKDTLESIATFASPKNEILGFTSNDYPAAAIKKHEQGSSGVRYWVSTDGRVRDCSVVEPSGSAVLDAQTCAIITKRGVYNPAKTKDGHAVESIGFSRVHWILPGS